MPAERPADRIRAHLAHVAELRARTGAPGLAQAVSEVKALQARRFAASYTDALADARQAPAARFFLEELYGDHDFRERDAQFGRIAGAIERLFPEQVAQLAVDMAEIHALTETLDHDLAGHWLAARGTPAQRYVAAWRATGQRAARERQLQVVQHMGRELQRLTKLKGLRTALRLMRGPARAAGLGALQDFLEAGFDAFAALGDATGFLHNIAERESRGIATLFDAPDAVSQFQPLIA